MEVQRILSADNYFTILGLSTPPTVSDIVDPKAVKKSYKQLALLVHPDKCKDETATDAFKLLTKAFECLKNPTTQVEYIRSLKLPSRKRSKTNCEFNPREYAEELNRKRENYAERKRAKRERQEMENEEFKDKFFQEIFHEQFEANCNAWKNWNAKKKPFKSKKTEFANMEEKHDKEEETELNGEHQHGEGGYVCFICLRRFTTRELLSRHEILSKLHKKNLEQRKREAFL